MYLPSVKEGADRLVKNKKACIAVAVLVVLAIAVGWLLCRHYDSKARADSANVTRTVQSVKEDNQRAREHVDAAARQIGQAGQQLNDIAESINASERTVSENRAVINDSQQLIESGRRNLESAEQILADIDRANQLDD